MNPDPMSLDNLRDIVEPPPVSWWPPAVGWWVLLALTVMALMVFSLRAWRHWRASAYRRAALIELEKATDVAALAETLKRTALAAFPRTNVASLSGVAWTEWLSKTGGLTVPTSVAQTLERGVYGAEPSDSHAEVKAFAIQWILKHSRK